MPKKATKPKAPTLTPKQQLFVDYYLGEARCNATRAAILAGYPEKSAYAVGAENLRKPQIQQVIRERFAASAMQADEVLSLLAEHARGSIGDFIRVRSGGGFYLDLKKAAEAGKLHLIREIQDGDKGVKLRLYDAQAALVQLGKHLRLFVERAEITGPDGGPIPVGLTFEDALRELHQAPEVSEPDAVVDPAGGAEGI